MPAGDWAQAGRISSQRFNNAMTAVAVNSVDPNKLIQASMKARSQEKQTAMKAEAALRGTEDDVRAYNAKVKSRLDIQEAQMGLDRTKRKAGMIAAAGSLIASGLTPTPDPIKPYMRDTGGLEQLISTQDAEIQKLRGDATKLQEEGAGTIPTLDRYTMKDLEPGGRLFEGGQSTISPTMGSQAKLDQTSSTGSTLTSSNTSSFFDTSKLTDKDFSELAYIVSGEAARGTDDEFGVAASVLNRVQSSQYPNTISAVGRAPNQYEAVTIGTARYEPDLAARLKSNVGKINSALETLQGRTDFKGQTMLKNRVASEDPMFDPKGNFFHYNYQ